MMKIQELRDYAHTLVGLPPNENCPVLTPRQLHPDNISSTLDEEFYRKLGMAAVHFLNTRKTFK